MIDSFRGKYYFLSNFYNAKLTYEGVEYLNNESAFQSCKLKDINKRKEFSNLNPSSAKRKGRHVQLRPDWEKVKFNIMYEIVKAKFEQNEDLRKRLINTGDEELIEGNTWGDKIWGKVKGEGQNNLGKILMRVRKELREGMNDINE